MTTAAALAACGLAAGAATAAPAAHSARSAALHPLSCTGHNGYAYISISGGPSGFTVSGSGSGFFGHLQITGPNGLKVSGPRDVPSPTLSNVHGTGAGRVYVIAWAANSDGSGWHNVGEPSCAVY
ncbi:hypothetical protein [Streptomyces sp. ICBB 8177]|uniref:hypothetical protein n=1 Tax=Streptomyces sp. ICBB 8177 TaxID=563922 RepID=UPI0011B4BAF6|nr:hypothetical protein [Streptomyces sp. ICBB 8177]